MVQKRIIISLVTLAGLLYFIFGPKSDSIEYFQYDFSYYYYFNFKKINILTPILIAATSIGLLVVLTKKYLQELKIGIELNKLRFVLISLGMVFSFAMLIGIIQFFVNYSNSDSFNIDKDVLGVEIKRDTIQFNSAIEYFNQRLQSAKSLKINLLQFEPSNISKLELRDFGEMPQIQLGYEINDNETKIHIVRSQTSPEVFYNYSIVFFSNHQILKFNTYSGESCDNFFNVFFTDSRISNIGDFSCIMDQIIQKEQNQVTSLIEIKKYAQQGSLNWQIFVFENLFKAVFNSEGYYKSTSWVSRFLSFSIYLALVLVWWPVLNLAIDKIRNK